MGEQNLKNIARPVRAYAIRGAAAAGKPRCDDHAASVRNCRS